MELSALGKSGGLLRLDNVLNYESEESLLKVVADAVQLGIKTIVLDFRSVDHMNSAGAGALVKLVVKAGQRRIKLYSFGLHHRYHELFSLTGIIEGIRPVGETAGRQNNQSAEEIHKLKEIHGVHGKQDDSGWAPNIMKLQVAQIPPGAMNKNVHNRRVLGPLQGFGPMWQKTYLLDINRQGLQPAEIISDMKQHFPEFQPAQNRFFPTAKGISAGEIVLIDSATPGGIVSTGVLVLYADDLSFTLVTPHGHPEAGWVTFSARQNDGFVRMQIQGLARASDPLFELAFRIAGSKFQETIWKHVLTSLAAHLAVEADVRVEKVCIGTDIQWRKMGNLWYNAQVRSLPYNVIRLFNRTGKKSK